MRTRVIFTVVIALFFALPSYSQIVGTDVFLQGHWLEIGQDVMGAFGTCSSPIGYHPGTCCGTGTFTPGGELDAVFDWGHDGWSTGTPAFMGDYTIPGYPQEGWGIQVGATEYRNWAGGGVCTGPFNIPGGNTSYTNSGGRISAIWTGNVAGLHIVQETRVDTEASWVIITTRLINTTAAPIANVYYERTCDPDNTSFWPGGTSLTENVIQHQNEDNIHRVMVCAYGRSGVYNEVNSLMALGTKDCRAKCGYLTGGLFPSATPSALFTGSGSITILNDSGYNDVGIWLVFNLGNIAASGSPGDTAILSYAYIYDTPAGIDSAFPDPQLVVNGAMIPNPNPPYPTRDTFTACDYPGILKLPLSMAFATDKAWTVSKWTWTPSTGLSTTTGVIDTVDISALTGPITYTVTGTDSALGMYSCNQRTFYLTVIPCHTAYANSPCVGDTLYLGDRGDSTSASYFWWGPASFTSAQQNTYRFPTSYADTGVYYVIRSIGSVHDTDSVRVTLHPLPDLTVTSNLPMCSPITDSLTLSVTPGVVGETFSWVGPNGFTSTMQFPVINPFDSSGQGTYFVSAVSPFGCKNSTSQLIYAAPYVQYDTLKQLGCVLDTVHFINLSSNADSFVWNFGDLSPMLNNHDPVHLFAGHHQNMVSLTAYNPHCWSTVEYNVDLRHSVHSIFHATPDTFCFDRLLGGQTTFIDTSYSDKFGIAEPLLSFNWNFGDGNFDATNFGPSHTYMTPGWYPVTLTVTDSLNCVDSMKDSVYVLQINIHSMQDTLLCIAQPLQLKSEISLIPRILVNYQYNWTQNTSNLNDSTIQEPYVWGLGTFVDTLTVTIPGVPPDACPTHDTITIHSVRGKLLTNVTPNRVIKYGESVQLNADSQVVYLWKPNDGSLTNCNINNPIATPQVTTTYVVYGLDINSCLDSAFVTIYVDSSVSEGIPSAFTPNGDGLNDAWHVVGMQFQKLVEIRIFNRWGQQVFYTNDMKNGWDGTFNGVPQETGTYFYNVIVARPGANGENIQYKGSITLIR